MNSCNRLLALAAVAITASLSWCVPAYLRARDNLVTLDVRDMEVRRVVKKIEWQTRERITVHNDVQGQVTFNVRKMPLDQVLKIVGEQTSSRWSALYPLYSSSRSLAALQKALRGDLEPAAAGWTNLHLRGGPPMGGVAGPVPGGPMRPGEAGAGATSHRLVSLQVFQKDVSFIALALNRFAQARVVPEDGVTATVNLSVQAVSVPEAVARLAKKADRRWMTLYTLHTEGGPGGPRRMAMRDGGRDRAEGAPTDPDREASRQQREALEEELKQALPDAERQKLELSQREREQQRQEMASLTPEQRRERMGTMMGGPNMAQRNLDRIKNTTPEQRAEQRRQMSQRRGERLPGQRPPG